MIEAIRQTFNHVRSKLTEQVYTLPLATYTKLVGELQFLKDLNAELQRQRDDLLNRYERLTKDFKDLKAIRSEKWTISDLKPKHKGRKIGSKNLKKTQ